MLELLRLGRQLIPQQFKIKVMHELKSFGKSCIKNPANQEPLQPLGVIECYLQVRHYDPVGKVLIVFLGQILRLSSSRSVVVLTQYMSTH